MIRPSALGWREEGLLGEPIAKLAGHRPRDLTGEWGEGFAVADLKPGDSPTRIESERIVGRDHTEIEISYTAAPFESELGEHGTVSVFADVTEQRSTERLAREKLEGLSWIGKIMEALDTDRLVPFAQPIVDLDSRRSAYHELLVRMLDDDGLPVAPGRFLVKRLAELGCGFALDDFGTGYGGFMYLKQLPIDFLKIDMEFVHDLIVNEGSQRVVRAVVDLAKGFGQQTIAEGIEDVETRDLLATMGVDFGQGYLFGRPAAIDQIFANDHEGAPR